MSFKIDGSCGSSVSSSSGLTEMPSQCLDTVSVNFDQFTTGTTNPTFPGLTISGPDSINNPMMIFDSETPTIGHEDLGSPNATFGMPPGSGVGAGGAVGMPGENREDQFKILIISDSPPTPGAPVPNADGGLVTVEFAEEVLSLEVHLMNVTVPCGGVTSFDYAGTELEQKFALTLGANSLQVIKMNVVGARKLEIDLKNDVGIAKIVYRLCRDDSRPCTKLICEKWDSLVEGETNISIQGGTVTTSNPGPNPPMIFNSSIPTAGDIELGTPNNTCVPAGPGSGAGGEVGMPGENCNDLEHVLIISDDGNPAIPKSATGGQFIFNFTNPVVVREVAILNSTAGDFIELFDELNNPINLVYIPDLGVNSYQVIKMPLPYPAQTMRITTLGKTAIDKVCYLMCNTSSTAASGDEVCMQRVVENWESFPEGDINIRQQDFTLSTSETMMIQKLAVPIGIDNVLIASTDGNSEVPTQLATIYTVNINYICPVWIDTMSFFGCDIPGCSLELFNWDNVSLGTFPIANLGAVIQTIDINVKGVQRIVVNTKGAITEINYLRCCKLPPLPNICTTKRVIDWEEFNVGERNIYIKDVTLTTLNNLDFPLMIFDSANPGADTQLGSPNTDFAGPGVGSGGATGSPGENSLAKSKVLIISKDAISETPSPKTDGGEITWTFDCPTEVFSIDVLNATALGDTIVFRDEAGTTLDAFSIGQYGANSVQTIRTDSHVGSIGPGIRGVKSFTIVTTADIAISNVVYTECCDSNICDNSDVCLEEVFVDFSEFIAGDINLNLGNITLSTGDPVLYPLMIFDTENPTGGDPDLGTPNSDFAGPGVGTGGETGKPGENSIGRGNALIISGDADQTDPDKKLDGGEITIEFDYQVVFKAINLIDMELDNSIEFFDKNNVSLANYWIPKNGNNGITSMTFGGDCGIPSVKKVVITLLNSGAILDFTYCRCKDMSSMTEKLLLIDNAMTPVEINTKLQGSYMIIVNSALNDGACATFMASSAFNAQAGSIVRLTNAPSITDETVNITWNANEKIKLFHDITKTGGTGATIPYLVRVFSL